MTLRNDSGDVHPGHLHGHDTTAPPPRRGVAHLLTGRREAAASGCQRGAILGA
jgi:hypothetical protein